MKDTTKNENEYIDNIIAIYALEKAHLETIEEMLEDLYDTEEPNDLDTERYAFLNKEEQATKKRIQNLREEYEQIMSNQLSRRRNTGEIVIKFEDITEDEKWALYDYLNTMRSDTGTICYKTIENTVKYSKDFV